jgi:dimethylamine/trimethylamine dehydrogenase
MGEEWRKGWHPEKIANVKASEQVLVIGGGPAGLEAARACGARGLEVTLAEASSEWGGRVSRESRLPGLGEWTRVRDWRLAQIAKMPNVNAYLESELTAEEVLSYGIKNVVIATGCHWRSDAIGRSVLKEIPGLRDGPVLTPDDLMAGFSIKTAKGPVIIFDDDNYYMGSLMAELAISGGSEVTLVTTEAKVASWTDNTLEQHRIQSRLLTMGVRLHLSHSIASRRHGTLDLRCVYTGKVTTVDCGVFIPVTGRLPNDSLYLDLLAARDEWADSGIQKVNRIGDCDAPNIIAHAVYAGHRYAQEFGQNLNRDYALFQRED